MSTTQRWSDIFTETSRTTIGNSGWKTTSADQIVWQGVFQRRLLCVVSTVRLLYDNMAHFCTNSGSRIGENDWNLRRGYYIDLAVISKDQLTNSELMQIAQLATTEETRPIFVRRDGAPLRDGIVVPPPS